MWFATYSRQTNWRRNPMISNLNPMSSARRVSWPLRILLISLLTLLVLRLASGRAHAEEMSANCDDEGSHLARMIDIANSNDEADTIKLDGDCETLSEWSLQESLFFPAIMTEITIVGSGGTLRVPDEGRGIFWVEQGAALTLIDLTLVGGQATHGGAIHNEGTLTLRGSEIRDSYAENDGGAINNEGTVILEGSVIRNNRADDNGGAIYNMGTLQITDSVLTENAADSGGAIYHDSADRVTLMGSTISGNAAEEGIGGGIYSNSASELLLAHSTVVDNFSRYYVGGIDAVNVQIRYSIIANNSSDYSDAVDCSGNVRITGLSLIENPTGCALQEGADLHMGGDPGLGSLQLAKDGRSRVHTPEPGSPVIDAVAAPADVPERDQLGQSRVSNGRLDLGAVEIQVASTCFATPDDGDTIFESTDVGAVQQAIDSLETGLDVDAAVIKIAGECRGFSPHSRETELNGSRSALYIDRNVTLQGGYRADNWNNYDPRANPTILDAKRAGRVLAIHRNGATVVIKGLSLINGSAADGAGLLVPAAALVTLESSTVRDNVATNIGGGILNESEATLTLIASTISGNETANDGGGLSNKGVAMLINSTISGNRAKDLAGGIENWNGAELVISHSTIYDNHGQRNAGGIQNESGSRVEIINSIIAGNTARGEPIDCNGTFHLSTTSLVENSQNCSTAYYGSNLLLTGESPKLEELQDNGGPVHTHAPQWGSPVIDADTARYEENTDQRGRARVVGNGIDLGAVEMNYTCFATPDSGATTMAGENLGVLQAAIDAADSDATIWIAGHCRGLSAQMNLTLPVGVHTALTIDKSLTLRGGYSHENWADAGPAADPTVLDAMQQGGIVTINTGHTVQIERLTLTGGLYGSGGALHNAGSTLTVRRSIIEQNLASEQGGGIYSRDGSVTLDAVTLRGNTAGEGGGIAIAAGTLNINSSTVADNETTIGGGGGILSAGALNISNSTISQNHAHGVGGGIVQRGETATLRFTTLYANRAANEEVRVDTSTLAAGIVTALDATVDLQYTILAGNQLSGAVVDCAGALSISAISLIERSADCTVSGAAASQLITGTPHLGPLQDNGGATWTHAPLPNSPVFDQAVLAETANATDQRGQPRQANGGVDLGAAELQLTCFATLDEGTTVLKSADTSAVQFAIDRASAAGAPDGTAIKVAGNCSATAASVDLTAISDSPTALVIRSSVTLQGGFAPDNWSVADPTRHPTSLDGAGTARVLAILDTAAAVQLQGLTLRNGMAATDGGAIHNSGTLTISQSIIHANRANDRGGGIYNGSGALTVHTSMIRDNGSARDGGGIASEGRLTVHSSTLFKNRAEELGGGVYSNGEAVVRNSTVSANSANFAGGGIYTKGDSAIAFATLAENRADSGANLALFHEGDTTTLFATILTKPLNGTNCLISESSAVNSLGYNRASDDSCALDDTVDGTDEQNAQILLRPLEGEQTIAATYLPERTADNSILDVVPLSGANSCEEALGGSPLDQRGGERPLRGYEDSLNADRCDVGAVEVGLEVLYVCGAGVTRDDPAQAYRCVYPSVQDALARAVSGDSIVISGLVTERITLTKNLLLRGPSAAEATPGTHMGFLQGMPTAPTDDSTATGPVVTVGAGATVTIRDLNIRHGNGTVAGALVNAGNTSLVGVTLHANRGTGNASAIHNSGTLLLLNSTLAWNSGVAMIENEATLRVINSTLAGDEQGAIYASGGEIEIQNSIIETVGSSSCLYDGERRVRQTGADQLRLTGHNLVDSNGCLIIGEASSPETTGTGTADSPADSVVDSTAHFDAELLAETYQLLSDRELILVDNRAGTLGIGVEVADVQVEIVEQISQLLRFKAEFEQRGLLVQHQLLEVLEFFEPYEYDNFDFHFNALTEFPYAPDLDENWLISTKDLLFANNFLPVGLETQAQIEVIEHFEDNGFLEHREVADVFAFFTDQYPGYADPASDEELRMAVLFFQGVDGVSASNGTANEPLPTEQDISANTHRGNPQLGPLRDNGGPTLTMVPAMASPALQGAASCSVADLGFDNVDQRGRLRPEATAGRSCTIGAVQQEPQRFVVCDNCNAEPTLGRFTDLQAALDQSMAGDVIALEAGTYTGNYIIYKDVTIEHAGINVDLLSRAESVDVRAILQASPLSIREQRALPEPTGSVLRVHSYAPAAAALEPSGDITVTLEGVTIRNGVSQRGGAIYNLGSLTLTRSTLTANAAVNRYRAGSANTDVINGAEAAGGAIYNAGQLNISHSTLSGNRSEYHGGAIYNDGAAAPARVQIQASTLADNLAARIGQQHLLLIDNDLLNGGPPQFLQPVTQTVSGDEILIQNRLPFAIPLNITGGSCNSRQIVALPSAVTTLPLICTAEGESNTITLASSQYEELTLDIIVTTLGSMFMPEAHILYQRGESTTAATVAHSLLVSNAPSHVNCGRSATAVINSGGYNLGDDTSCSLDQATDLTPGVAQYRDPGLGPLQDNNWIDFERKTVSGYTYVHALAPGSPAIDQIPSNECSTALVTELLIINGQSTRDGSSAPLESITLDVGGIVVWKTNPVAAAGTTEAAAQAMTLVLNDGHHDAQIISLAAGEQSRPIQFAEPGRYPYRIYDSQTRMALSEAIITVRAGSTQHDQRGIALPQRGTAGQFRCDIGAYEFKPYIVGERILRPPAAVGSSPPSWELGNESLDAANPPYHVWSPATARDYPLHPTPNNQDGELVAGEIVTLIWTTNADPQERTTMRQTGVVEWPDDPQLHVAGAHVNLTHLGVIDDFLISDARAFEGRGPEDDAAGTILSNGVFSRTQLNAVAGDSYSVLTFVKDAQSNATAQVLVVKSVDWNAPGVRDLRADVLGTSCVIGRPLAYTALDAAGLSVQHVDPEGRAGQILYGRAYDGVEREAELTILPNTLDGVVPPIHVRATRAGEIIPVLAQAPTEFPTADLLNGDHDLRVAWYRPDARNVAWPVKAVGYRCRWPENPPQIVIASELGSEIDAQPILAPESYLEPSVYHQADPTQPGYSPNFEHALLADSNLGNTAPALYALRTDLFDRNPVVDASQSYVLLKYRDAREANQPKIAVYQTQLTRAAQQRGAAAAIISVDEVVVPANGEVTVPVRVSAVQRMHAITVEIPYENQQLRPVRCMSNRDHFVTAPHGLQLTSDQPARPGNVVRLRADLMAGTDVRYQWSFGDGTVRIAGPEVSHVYGTAGTYAVEVTAFSTLFPATVATTNVTVADDALPGTLAADSTNGCHVITATDATTSTIVLALKTRDKHGLVDDLILADITFAAVAGDETTTVTTATQPRATAVVGPGYEALRFDVVAGNPIFAPVPMRNLLDIQTCAETTVHDIPNAKPFWKDFKGNLWARAAGSMDVLYYYPIQPGFHFTEAQRQTLGLDSAPATWVGRCVPWLHNAAPAQTVLSGAQRIYPVDYQVAWPDLPPTLVVGETVYERAKNGISGVAEQLAVNKIYDDIAPGQWIENSIVIEGSQTVDSLAQLIDPIGEVRVPLDVRINDNPALPTELKTERLLFGGGQAIVGTADNEITLPFSLRSRIGFDDLSGELIFRGHYDGTSSAYIKGDPLLLLNVMAASDRVRLQALCQLADGATAKSEECKRFISAIDALYHKSRNPRAVDLCRTDSGALWPNGSPDAWGAPAPATATPCVDAAGVLLNPPAWRDGRADRDFLIGVQDRNNDGLPEPYAGLGKGKALSAGNAQGTGYITLAYNNDESLDSLPVSLQVIQVGCALNANGENSTYRGNLLTIESDNLFDEKLTVRHTGDFGGMPDNFEFQWFIAGVDDTGVSPLARPPSYPWQPWTKVDPGATAVGSEITIEGANPTTLSDNWLLMRYKGYAACGNQYRYSAFAGDPSAKPSEVRAQLAEGWIKRVTNALNPFDARVRDFVSAPVNTTVDMISQAGPRYEGPIPFSNDPETLNGIGLIEAYQTVLDRGRTLSIDSQINDQGANAALLNVTSRIAELYLLLANDAYADALDPTVAIGTEHALSPPVTTLYAFMNQFRPDSFGPIDEELTLLRGRDEVLGGVAAGPVYNRLTWNFTNGPGTVAYQQNYNIQDTNEDGFIDEADAALRYPQGHGDAWGHLLTALQSYYNLLRHSHYTWSPRAEPVSVAGAPVVVDYYDERRFATAAATKAQLGAEIVGLTYRKHYAEPTSQGYVDGHIDSSDQAPRAWGVADWAVRAGQGAYIDWVVANAILPPEESRFSDVRKVDRSTVLELQELVDQYQLIQQQLDNADTHVNPLGVAPNAVLFDLNAAAMDEGQTHFEQIYQRAITTLDTTHAFFEHAVTARVALRDAQATERDFVQAVVDADTAIVNELIELFGYPYDADVGVNGTYPAGYQGPDIYNYDLYDRNELTDHQKRCHSEDVGQAGHCAAETKTMLIAYEPLQCVGNYVEYLQSNNGKLNAEQLCPRVDVDDADQLTVTHVVGIGLDAGRGRFKPSSWPGNSARPAVGEIQNAIQALTQARLDYERAIVAYEDHIERMVSKQKAIKDRVEVLDHEEEVKKALMGTFRGLDGLILVAKQTELLMENVSDDVEKIAESSAKCAPLNVGFSNDVTSAVRCGINLSGLVAKTAMSKLKLAATIAENVYDYAKDTTQQGMEFDLLERSNDYEIRQLGREISGMFREERELRMALFLAKDQVNSAQGTYDQILQRAFRKLEELSRLRKRWAGQISGQRYNDMAYRTVQSSALQKYRRQYDLAQLYVYLTAAAYDYETSLTASDGGAGAHFLRQIVGLRNLGHLEHQLRPDGTVIPLAGMGGLADPMARMHENFSILKGQLGFNNPQPAAKLFSLRRELFRLTDASDLKWRQTLQRYYVPNIYANDAVARLAKRPYGGSDVMPGLIIPFGTGIVDGENFFGHPLGTGDNAYNATQFSTKIRRVGIFFDGYDGQNRLSNAPQVYLVPAGYDVLRPRHTADEVRYWSVAEQLLPLPHAIGANELHNPGWLTTIDGLDGQLYATKRFPRLSAFAHHEDLSIDGTNTSSLLIGRSVWNTQWLLVIPGAPLLADPATGLDRFIEDVDDIKLYIESYSYSGAQ